MKERKLNNKGFSLVELIIVIAIMVILVVVFAPQYLRFVNNSRISTDVQTAGNMVTAVEAAIAEGQHPFGTPATAITNGSAVVNGLNTMPASRLTGNNTSWTINGTDTTGVTSVILTVNGNQYQCYPDVEADADPAGINRMNNAATHPGLRQ